MARRVWQVQPDFLQETALGEIPVVSQQALMKGVADGVVLLDRAGGCLSVVLVREPTGVPNEMVTTRAIVEWKDRTDARPQPELADPFDGQLSPAPPADVPPEVLEASPALAAAPVGDGLDELDGQVDESSIPEPLRS